jgi:hypothetical protein
MCILGDILCASCCLSFWACRPPTFSYDAAQGLVNVSERALDKQAGRVGDKGARRLFVLQRATELLPVIDCDIQDADLAWSAHLTCYTSVAFNNKNKASVAFDNPLARAAR